MSKNKDIQEGDLESKYMVFRLGPVLGKTSVWHVLNKSTLFLLGIIKWYGPWRQYVFMPEGDTVFNDECLARITGQVKQLNFKWRFEQKQKRVLRA